MHNKWYDPDAAPAGKSAVTAFLESDYRFWDRLRDDREGYEAEKRRCAEAVIDTVAATRSGFRDAIEVIDVSTPLTRERYTGNRMGAMQALRPSSAVFGALRAGGDKYSLREVPGFMMAGQWVEPWGGITTAAQSGRNAVKAMCRADGLSFDA